GDRDGDVADHARSARRPGEGSPPLLPRAGVEHGARPHHFRERGTLRSKTMKICVAGQGAFGQKNLDALKRIPGPEIVSLTAGNPGGTEQVAKKYGVSHWGSDLGEGIKRADAVILATPTKMHFKQAEQVMRAGKHVLVEIPVTDSVEDAENLVKIARETGV